MSLPCSWWTQVRRRALHVATENARVLGVAALLRKGDLRAVGPVLTSSHRSMREDFEITVPAVEVVVRALLDSGALGARMTGGGFGGCVIGLLPRPDAAAAERAVIATMGKSRLRYSPVDLSQPASRRRTSGRADRGFAAVSWRLPRRRRS